MSTIAEPVAAVHTTASPRLTFKDAAKAIEFYKQAFGAKETFRFEAGGRDPARRDHDRRLDDHADGRVAGRRPVQCGNAGEFAGHDVARVFQTWTNFSPSDLRAGAKSVIPIADQFYGHREGTLQDPFGYLWSVSTCDRRDVGRRDAPAHEGDDEGPSSAKQEAGGESDSAGLPHGDALHSCDRWGCDARVCQERVWRGRNFPGDWRSRRNSRRDAHRRHDADDGRRAFRASRSMRSRTRRPCTFMWKTRTRLTRKLCRRERLRSASPRITNTASEARA